MKLKTYSTILEASIKENLRYGRTLLDLPPLNLTRKKDIIYINSETIAQEEAEIRARIGSAIPWMVSTDPPARSPETT